MALKEILLGGSGGLILLLTLIQIAPIKVNPWSALARMIGGAINAEVLAEIKTVNTRLDDHIQKDAEGKAEVLSELKAVNTRLDEHIQKAEEGKADDRRTRILQFNNELIRDIPHTKEEFVDILVDIDDYEAFCRSHPDYRNSRATYAIANIGRVYNERLQKHDFAT